MKLSAKAKYALRAMFDIAYHNPGSPSKVEQIARREDIPAKFLEQTLRTLKEAGLLISRRGRNGGYLLKKPADEITVGAVITAIEGPVLHGCCYETDAETIEHCEVTSKCVTAAVWRDLAFQINEVLEQVTLAEICGRADQFGIRPEGQPGFMYVI